MRACCPLLPTAPLVLDLDAKQAGNKTQAYAAAAAATAATLSPRQRPCCPLHVVNVKQADNKRRACAATMTTAMRPFVVASVASPLVIDAKQADDVGRACAAAA